MGVIEIPVRVILDAVDRASKEISKVGDAFDGFTKNATIVGAGLSAVGAGTALMAKGFIDAAGAMEQNTIAFETMLGNADKAKTLLSDIEQFAKATPFNLPELIEGSKRLLAFGSTAEDIIPTMEALGNISAGVGREKLPDLIRAFGQVQAKGKLMAQELNQFAEAGVPLRDMLARDLKMSIEDFSQELDKGNLNIKFDQVKKSLFGLTEEGGRFNDLMAKQSQSTLGKISNLEDGFMKLQRSLGNALLPALNTLVDKLIPLVDKFAAFAAENPKLVAGIIALGLALGAIGAVLLAIGPLIAGITASWGLLSAIVTGFGAAVSAVIAVIGAPLLLVLGLIAGAVALLAFAWKNNWGDIQGKTQEVIEGIRVFIDTAVQKFNEFIAFIPTIPQKLEEMEQAMKDRVYKFFVEDIPYALGYAAGWLVSFVENDVQDFVTKVINWFSGLPKRIDEFMNQLRQAIITQFNQSKESAITTTTSLYNQVTDWFSKLPGKISEFLSALPGIVSKWFEDAKTSAVNKAKEMYEGVGEWFKKIKEFFQDILNKANEALNKGREALSSGFSAGQKRQHGGPVSTAGAYLVGEKGPELFVPNQGGRIVPNGQVAGAVGGGKTEVHFHINANTIINSPAERRQFAEAIWRDLVILARSQNRDVQDIFQGV